MYKNIYYFRNINSIGGIETFFQELAKKYRHYDLTFFYQDADKDQLKELKKYCRCIQFKPDEWLKEGKRIQCINAFFNFNLEFLDFVDAQKKILVVHGNYKELKVKPPQDARINEVIAVSEDSAKAYTELTGIKCGVCSNPLTYEQVKPALRLICACRLGDRVKGSERLEQLVSVMDKYCEKTNNNYLLTIFTNSGRIDGKNVVTLRGRTDIRPYLASSDYLIQLSSNEGYCYSVNEMLYLFKKPVVITPCKVYEELGIDETMSIRLNFDMSNVDEVVEQMFTKTFKFNYKPPMDKWDELLVKGESTYEREKNMLYKVRALEDFTNKVSDSTKYDNNGFRELGEEFIVDANRYQELLNYERQKKVHLIELVEQIQNEPIKEVRTETKEDKVEVKKAVKKTTRKKA